MQKQIQLDLSDYLLSKEIPVSVMLEDALQHPQWYFGDVERAWACTEHPIQKGVGTTWPKLSEALLVFLFSLGQRQAPPHWTEQDTSGLLPLICSCNFAGIKQPNSLLVFFP